ncbi:hypothetical protein D9C73_021380 [Collichthys lucidus]|uniref:MAX gene-associated protein n=1 Tax=Collichthys lucidus TaxID=240159 RepID=A0A4U5VGQ0_COLLU|nr:hypothetical protein D9C73_021380 [Collichthys lucidus]
MALDRLDRPFWIKKYLISPISQTVEESGADRCIQYKIHISRPRLEREEPAGPVHLKQVAREAEPLEDWQREVEEDGAGPLEDWQREVEEEDIEEDMDSTAHHVHDGRERSKEEVRSKKKKMVTMALPFLTGISPAGFLSANRKQPGGTEHLVQVNRKFYPLAKIQLGKMGALHPANRLAAYLTAGGVQQESTRFHFLASGPCQNQSTGSTVQTASPVIPAVSGLAADPSPRSQAADTVLTIPAPPTVLQPAPVKVERAASSDQPSGKAPEGAESKVVTVKVFVRPTGGASQRMVLQPVQAVPGVQYYRRPDGKLVQLVPISQLRPFNPNQLAPRGPSPSVHPVAPPETPVLNQTFPVTTVTTSPSHPSLSGLQSFSVSPAPSQLGPAHRFLSNKETCTFRILPTNSSREPILVTCAKVPPTPRTNVAPGSFTLLHPFAAAAASPVNLISLKPSAGQGAELGVKTVTVSAVPVGPGEVQQKPASPQTTATRPPPPSPESKVTPVPTPCPPVDRISAAPEPACDPGDLDVICVEDETWRVATETVGVAEQSADAVEISSGSDGEQADNAATIGDETDGDKDRETTSEMQRHIHNVLEKKRRVRLHRLFEEHHSRHRNALLNTRQQKLSEETSAETGPAGYLDRAEQRGETEESEDVFEPAERRLRKSEQSVLSELRHLTSSNQRTAEEPHQSANQLPAEAAASRAVDDIIITSSDLRQAPPTLTPVHQAQSSLQATPSVSHNASCMLRDRPRTVPNILSRRRKQAPPTTPPETTAESLALVPAEVLSLVGAALPGQPVLSLNPLQTLPPSATSSPGPGGSAPPGGLCRVRSDQRTEPGHGGRAPDSECLTSLLNEIVFLNQQVVTTATTTGVLSPRRLSSEVGPQDEGHAHSPWLLQLDSDSDDIVTMETVEVGLNNGPQPANENTTSGVLAPPPLLQMKVGGAKVADSVSNHEATEEGVGGTAWRPMPRLVPLGLRGNPAS